MPETQSQRRLVPIRAAAAKYGIHTNTIRRRIADGTIRAYRFGPRVVRVDLDELDAAFGPAAEPNGVEAPSAPQRNRAEMLAEHVARVVAQAPPLTDEQRERIAALLRAGGAA